MPPSAYGVAADAAAVAVKAARVRHVRDALARTITRRSGSNVRIVALMTARSRALPPSVFKAACYSSVVCAQRIDYQMLSLVAVMMGFSTIPVGLAPGECSSSESFFTRVGMRR